MLGTFQVHILYIVQLMTQSVCTKCVCVRVRVCMYVCVHVCVCVCGCACAWMNVGHVSYVCV